MRELRLFGLSSTESLGLWKSEWHGAKNTEMQAHQSWLELDWFNCTKSSTDVIAQNLVAQALPSIEKAICTSVGTAPRTATNTVFVYIQNQKNYRIYSLIVFLDKCSLFE